MKVIIIKYNEVGISNRYPNHYIARADGQWYAEPAYLPLSGRTETRCGCEPRSTGRQ